jgi:tetratricopeptide (TPR) repeat protein
MLVLLLLGPGSFAVPAVAQKPAPQQNVTAVVVNALPQPPQPVKAVRVSLSYLESARLITDAQQVTNTQGQALLVVSGDVAQRGNLRIEITGASNLVIYEPADGQLSALPATIQISLLPKGSAALLGPAQIEATLHRLLLQVNSLEKQVSVLKAGAAPGQGQQPDLGAAIAVWAQANGFSSGQVDQQVQQWAEGIQKQSGQATAEQKALAELALKHYAAAAQLFKEAGNADRQELNAEDTQEQQLEAQIKALQAAQQALVDKQRSSSLRKLLDHSQQEAAADQLNLQYHQATQTLENAAATVEVEYKKHPDDKGFHELWLEAVWAVASARGQEGAVSPANESLGLLALSADDFDSLAREYAVLGDRQEVAAAQDGLGDALTGEGERASGDKAVGLLDQAVEAFQNALQVFTKADLPQDWAQTQNNLGIALDEEGTRATGDKAMALLDQAVEAYQNALQVYTKTDLPRDWAMTQNNLGNALAEEGEGATGDKATALFDQAVKALRNALQVYTKADLPQDWAGTQVSLGNALWAESERATGDKATALLDQAVQAYQNALQVYTKTDLPQDWASTQNNLGNALAEEGRRATGDKAMALLDQAVVAYRSALEVYTKADLPQDWAMMQNNLGAALLDEGERASGDKAIALLNQAVVAFRDALEVYTKVDLPRYWSIVQINLMEANLVSARFDACSQGAKAVTDDMLWASLTYLHNTIGMACAWAVGDTGTAKEAWKTLYTGAIAITVPRRNSTGVLRYLSSSPEFANGRASWIALFTAVQNGDSAGMTAALHQLEPIF